MNTDQQSFALAKVQAATTLESRRGVDAVVIGAGAAGGLAALHLTEAGLRVAVLDAGSGRMWPNAHPSTLSRMVNDAALRLAFGLRSTRMMPFRQVGRAMLRAVGLIRQPIQSQCGLWTEAPQAYVDDLDCPYVTEPNHPF